MMLTVSDDDDSENLSRDKNVPFMFDWIWFWLILGLKCWQFWGEVKLNFLNVIKMFEAWYKLFSQSPGISHVCFETPSFLKVTKCLLGFFSILFLTFSKLLWEST